MGQVLAVQELLCLLCLHDQAAKMFCSSKSAVQESTLRKQASSPVARPALAARCRITAATRCIGPAHTYTRAVLSGNYRGPQKRGQPHRDVAGLCWEARHTAGLNSKPGRSERDNQSCQQTEAGRRHLEDSKQAKHTLDCSCCM